MSLLVTGGSGYLGQTLLRLAPQGWELGATHYHQTPQTAEVQWFRLDIRDPKAVQEVFEAFCPEVVIHTAYQLTGPQLWGVTAEGSQHVARAARALGARLLHLSTDLVFDGTTQSAYREADPPNPITPYGQAKLQAERWIAEHPDWVTVRTSLMYGFDPPDRGTRLALELADGKAQGQLFTDEYRSPVYVEDLALALLELAQTSYKGVLHLAGPDSLSRYQLGAKLARAYGRDPNRLPTGLASEFPNPRPLNCTLDSSRAKGLLQTRLRGVDEVLLALDPRPPTLDPIR